ncbi:MAG: hypothetical protein OXD31_10160 [Chloroflexi bacterium]|nr:hypothetical protein [Chloroflexota bacterium]
MACELLDGSATYFAREASDFKEPVELKDADLAATQRVISGGDFASRDSS